MRCVALTILLAASTASAELNRGLSNLYQMSRGETRRVSSSDPNWQDGNGDCRPIAPGGTLTIAEIDGPGIIRHIWFTISAEDPQYPRSLTLRMYWDGSDEPAVESPIGDFFAVGHGALTSVNSIPVAVTSEGRAYNCYWPMPFRKGAKITITNDSKKYRVGCVFWYVDYETPGRELPEDTAYFHAQYRQEYPARKGEDYLILETEGQGHYVGTVLSAQLRTEAWFGEGDDRFYIDGATEPQLQGTGTEDYFCDAWGFRKFDRPYYGVTLLDGYQIGDRVTAYRWHIADPVHFKKSLKVTIEHKGAMVNEKHEIVSGFAERFDHFSSVAFWYQTGKAKRFAELPPAEERVLPSHKIEAEAHNNKLVLEPADTGHIVQNGPCSGGAQTLALFKTDKAKLTLPFELDKPVTGVGRLLLTRSFDYGIWRVELNGQPLPGLQPADLYSPDVNFSQEYSLGYLDLPASRHELTFTCVGKNPASKGYYLGVDALRIEEITRYFVNPEKK